MDHTDQEIENAEKLVANRCIAALKKYLDTCENNPGRTVTWGSDVDPWLFRVTYVDEKWILDDIEFEIEGVEELFEGEDLTSRDGVDHVIGSVIVPLAIEAALGDIPDRTAEQFLVEMESCLPIVQ